MIPAPAYPIPTSLLQYNASVPYTTVLPEIKVKSQQTNLLAWLPVWQTHLSYIKHEGELFLRWIKFANLSALSKTAGEREMLSNFQGLVLKEIPKILQKVNWMKSEFDPDVDLHLKVNLLKPRPFKHIHHQITETTRQYDQLKICILEKLVDAYPVRIV